MTMEMLLRVALIGLGAALCMDGWALLLKQRWRIASFDYALAGRWLLWMGKGRFIHHSVINTPSLAGEKQTGWILHYVIGIGFAFIPLLFSGTTWLHHPDLSVAILSGLVTVAAAWFIMQPALGFGVAASRTVNPSKARLFSLLAHLAYGVGLYFSGIVIAIWPF